MIRTTTTVIVSVLLLAVFAYQTWSQPAAGPGPVYDATNQAYRVNVVAGAAGGLSASTFGVAFPSSGVAVGFQDTLGAFASISATNRLPVTCDNCSSSAATFGAGFPSSGGAVGFKDNSGSMASATVDNAGRQMMLIAAGSQTNATVTQASSTVFAVRTTSDSTLTATVSQAAASVFNTRSTSDSTVTATVTQTTASSLNMRPDFSSATGSQASARVALVGGLGASASAANFLACNQFASISTANSGNWRLVASESNKNVYVCGYTFVASGPVAIKFVAGQGPTGFGASPCITTSSDLTGAMNVAASGGVVNASSPVPILKTGVAQQLCINLSDGKQVSGHINYSQF